MIYMYFVCNFCQHNASCVCVCLVVASINMVTFIKQKQTFPYISFHAIFGDFLSCTSHVAECVISITETTLINFSLHVDLCYRYSRGLMCMYIPQAAGVTIITVAVGFTSETSELIGLTSHPISDNLIYAEDYAALEQVKRKIIDPLCSSKKMLLLTFLFFNSLHLM